MSKKQKLEAMARHRDRQGPTVGACAPLGLLGLAGLAALRPCGLPVLLPVYQNKNSNRPVFLYYLPTQGGCYLNISSQRENIDNILMSS